MTLLVSDFFATDYTDGHRCATSKGNLSVLICVICGKQTAFILTKSNPKNRAADF